jgi:Piwi domain
MFIGVDVFHAAMVYDVENKKRGRKASCAAVVVTVIRNKSLDPRKVETFSKTFSRAGGNEYQLGDALEDTVNEAKRVLKVEPKSVVVWRDGIAETAEHHAIEEINGVRRALQALKANTVGTKGAAPVSQVPLAYIVCQKRISTKLLTQDGGRGAASGTMVTALQGLQHQTFYINGRAPPYSTAKPVRFICIRRDDGLNGVPLGELTWSECHNYPNWAGPVKVPAVCQMAHKLAEMGGTFSDGGKNINDVAYANKLWFL